MEEETYFKLSTTTDKNFSLDVLKTLIEKDIPFSYSNNTIVVNKTNLSEEQREAIKTQRPNKSLCKECSVIKGESKLTEEDKLYVEGIIKERVGLRPLPPSKPKQTTLTRSPKRLLPSSPKRLLPSSPRRLPMPSRIINIKSLEEK
jgi:hypothetical protein